MTQDYYGTKRVTAWPAEKDGKPGYSVKYADGYISWSPEEVFEEAYQPLDALSFGHALVALKEGRLVARAGWNGKGMWLVYLGPGWQVDHPVAAIVPENTLGFIAMKTADQKFVPWLASQTDMLANDWTVLPQDMQSTA